MKVMFLALLGLLGCAPPTESATAPAPAPAPAAAVAPAVAGRPASAVAPALPAPRTWGYQVVRTYPHDPTAFTQGLIYLNGYLYEGTGQYGQSEIRKVRLATGEVLQRRALDPQYFGEGIVAWRDRLLQITWQQGTGFIYDLKSFQPKGQFSYEGEGWGLTHDGRRIILSDGTPRLRFLDPKTLAVTGGLDVTHNGAPLGALNEIEWVKGEIFANVWQTDIVVRINPKTGVVVGVIDLSGLLSATDRGMVMTDVLNGIAYDARRDRLFVTGKYWPKLYEIRLVERLVSGPE